MFIKKKNKLWKFLGLFLFLFIIYLLAKNIRNVESIIREAGLAGPVVAIILYGIFAVTPISTDPLTVISGVVFGPFIGVIISWLGNNIAAMEEYYFGKHIRVVANFEKSKQRLPFGLKYLPVSSPWFLIFGRLIPGYGGKIISIMAGINHVPLSRYLWTTALTNFFGSILLALGGYHLINLIK